MVAPDGISSIKAMKDWHEKNDRIWTESPPANNPAFTENWFLRCKDLLDQYQPDVIYFDNTELPLGQAGLDIVAHYYNANFARNTGKLDAVVNAKHMGPEHAPALVEDIERGVATGIRPHPWQTDTCLGMWHYSRAVAEQHKYKTAAQVIRMLLDIVSKNGNLMLNVPLRGDGTIDAQEQATLEDLAGWMKTSSEGIFASRPWKVYGEGPSTVEAPETGEFGGARDVRTKPYTIEDIRFTTKASALYAYLLTPKPAAQIVIESLAKNAPHIAARTVTHVSLVGGGSLEWSHDEQGLRVKLPDRLPAQKPLDSGFEECPRRRAGLRGHEQGSAPATARAAAQRSPTRLASPTHLERSGNDQGRPSGSYTSRCS
jgi:alpha-L-fucosidase